MRRDTRTGTPDFYAFARDYLHTYLPTIRGLSANTIEAYRISLECFLTFLTDHEHIDRATVSFDHFDRARLKAWLVWLADDQHYATRTVTLRLSAIKAFLACRRRRRHPRRTQPGGRTSQGCVRAEEADRVPHRARNQGRPRRLHRPDSEITPQPDAPHPALRHRRTSR